MDDKRAQSQSESQSPRFSAATSSEHHDFIDQNEGACSAVHKMLEVQSLYKPTPPHQPTAKRRRLRLTSVPLVDLRSSQRENSHDAVDLYGSLSSPPKSLISDTDAISNKSGVGSVSDSMDSQRLQGSCRIRHLNSSWETESRFPKLNECAHFHYEFVELGPIDVCLFNVDSQENCKPLANGISEHSDNFSVQVASNGKSWVVRRSYENFCMLDRQLHQCVYDRKFSALPEILPDDTYEPKASAVSYDEEDSDDKEQPNRPSKRAIEAVLSEYLHRFSDIAGNLISCGPILNWLELDNRGNRLIVADDSAINTPAVAAAYVTKRYISQANDEISFEVGDMISVIDMPPSDESIWWRGKRGFEVGFFPSECVEVIGDKVPHTIHIPKAPTKPVLRKHGKLIAFFRSFILSRPSRRKLKQSGILRERVFGCDLGEHLLNSGHDIPMVLKCCADFIEAHGIVDGIYRLSGVTSNIQKLRNTFDEDRVPNLKDEAILQDIHSVASLLKMYFRELPNPLLTYQLYDKFVAAVQSDEEVRLLNLRDIVQQMPPPHYRTLEYLVKHLACVAAHGGATGMTPKNLAIVWAPNLLRSKDLEIGGVAALQVVGVQAVVTEFLIHYSDLIFNDKMPVFPPVQGATGGSLKRSRPKSLAISTPTKLLSLEEARSRALGFLPGCQFNQKYIEVGGGPATLPSKYHTIIDLPDRKRGSTKSKKSPSGWKSFFVSKGRSSSQSSRDGDKNRRKGSSTPSDPGFPLNISGKAVTEVDMARNMNCLRTVKSAESLVSSCATSSHRNSDVFDMAADVTRCLGESGAHVLSAIADKDNNDSVLSSSVGAVQSTPQRHSPHAHHRSVSHDSYFEFSHDHRPCERPSVELATILSVDHEDSDTPILSTSDYADICFADQEKEPDANGALASDASPAEDNIEASVTNADADYRLSFNFDDVSCNIIGDIQKEVAAALHWNKDAQSSQEDDNISKHSDDVLTCGTNDEAVVSVVRREAEPTPVERLCHPSLVNCDSDPSEQDNLASDLKETSNLPQDVSLRVSDSVELLPPVSIMGKSLSLPDSVDHISLDIQCLHTVPCDAVQKLTTSLPTTICEVQHNTEVQQEDHISANTPDVPEINLWTEQSSPEDQTENGCHVLQTGGLDAPNTVIKLMIFEGETNESDSTISHNLSSCGVSSSAASPSCEEIYDPFAYAQLTNEEESDKSPSLHDLFSRTISNECGEIEEDLQEKFVPEVAHDENKENDGFTAELSAGPENSTMESLDSNYFISLPNESSDPLSPLSPSRVSEKFLTTAVPVEKLSPVEESKRKFESEIGRDILRERKMKLELERIQQESQQRPRELLNMDIVSSSCESVPHSPVIEESNETVLKEETKKDIFDDSINEMSGATSHEDEMKKEVGEDGISDMHSLEEMNQTSKSVTSTNSDEIALDHKVLESRIQPRTPNRSARPERKASVRELLTKFEGRKGGNVSALSKEASDNFSSLEVHNKPQLKKNADSVDKLQTPFADSTVCIIDNPSDKSLPSVVPVDLCTRHVPDEGDKSCDTLHPDFNLLSKSASGKLETYGSEFPLEKEDFSNTTIILGPITVEKGFSVDDKSMIDPARRERIDRYKEERRAQLREKIRSDSFKGELEDQKDYVSRLRQKAMTQLKQLDDLASDAEKKDFICSSWRRSRLSAGSPSEDNSKSESTYTRRRSALVHRHSVESNLHSDYPPPASPSKSLSDKINSTTPLNRKILSSVEDNTKDLAESMSKVSKGLSLDSLRKTSSSQMDSMYIEHESGKLTSPSRDKVLGHSGNSNSLALEDVHPRPPPLRKIKEVAALFEQPPIMLQRQCSREGDKIRSKVSSSYCHLKTNYPSNT